MTNLSFRFDCCVADIELISGAFVRCSYPYTSVCFEDVKQLLSDLGWKGKEQDIFRCGKGDDTGCFKQL